MRNLSADVGCPTRVMHPYVTGRGKSVRPRIKTPVEHGVVESGLAHDTIDGVLLVFDRISLKASERCLQQRPD
ncbi:MAG: hypothetical protein ACK55I_40025, partial [bacterium]